jgi:hypothetical protein
MRVYISGAITGTDDHMERFAKVEKYLKSAGYSVINPAKVNAQMPEDTTYEEYIKMSITMLDMCDAIFLLTGWQCSRGARFERKYASLMEKKTMYEVKARENND